MVKAHTPEQCFDEQIVGIYGRYDLIQELKAACSSIWCSIKSRMRLLRGDVMNPQQKHCA